MRQLIVDAPGRLAWREGPEPTLQAPRDALVRPIAVSICDADNLYLRGEYPIRPPFCFGHEFVAEVVSLGEQLQGFEVGDQVVVAFIIACGHCRRCRSGLPAACLTVNAKAAYGFGVFGDWGGAFSDLVRVPYADYMMTRLPQGVPPAVAASAGDNLTDAFRCISEGLEEEPGSPVLIVAGDGRAPSVSLYAVALARALGSEQVDYLDRDPARLALAEALGARALEASAGPPKPVGRYFVTADTSGDPTGSWLGAALGSTAPYGRCGTCGLFHGEGRTPLGLMYTRGVRLTVGWTNVQAHLPKVLALLEASPTMLDKIHTVASWDDAIEQIETPRTKLILTRC